MTEQHTEHEEAPVDEAVSGPPADEGNTETVGENAGDAPESDPDTFPKEYVVKLRDEAAKYRQRAADRDTLAERLHVALVTATGRLADPTDLDFDQTYVDDPEALTTALDDLLARKPHLASRRVVGDVGQGATQGDTAVDLAGMLRRNAS